MLEKIINIYESIPPEVIGILFWLLFGVLVYAIIRVIKKAWRALVLWFDRTFGDFLCERGFHDYSQGRSVQHHDLDTNYEVCRRCGDENKIPHW